jgi:hypothetical protein
MVVYQRTAGWPAEERFGLTSQLRSAAAGRFTELPPPAMTIVGVASLPGSGMRVAVDGVAVLRGEYPDRER